MMERMFKVSHESNSLRISIANIDANKYSANNEQRQIRLAHSDFLYDANKEEYKHNSKSKLHNFPNMKMMK